MKRNPLTIAIGFLLIVLFILLLFTFQVRTTEVAVVTTFGRPTRDITNATLYLKMPWPVQRVHYFDKRVQTFEDKFTEDFTADNNTLLTMVYIGWRITDPKEFFPKFRGGSVLEAEKRLADLVRSAKSAIVGRHNLSDFVSADGTKFQEIESQILEDVRNRVAANQYGIEIEFLGFKRLGLPESVTEAVFARMRAERQVRINASQYQGEAEAQRIRSDAERRAAEILATAEGEAAMIRSKGEAATAETLAIFERNPELASFLLRLTALEQSLNERSTLIFDQKTPPFDVFSGSTVTNRPASPSTATPSASRP